MSDLTQLYEAVVSGNAKATQALTQQALAEGVDPLKLVNEYMVPAMDEVGRRFEANEYFVPELLISARAMKSALELIRPLLTARRPASGPRRHRHRQRRFARHRQEPRRLFARRRRVRSHRPRRQCDVGEVHRYH